MHATASTIAAALLTAWALVAAADRPAPRPQPAAATAPAQQVTASALGDIRTLNRYPGN
jgi:hypothetical protein